jgi:hypothetical protein
MSLQIQLEKNLNQYNFLESTVYDRYDLTDLIKKDEKFVVRQGDLVITNYIISDSRKRGLRHAWLNRCKGRNDNIWIFGGNHFIISMENETVVAHPEHGIVVIPLPMHELVFYTFDEAKD